MPEAATITLRAPVPARRAQGRAGLSPRRATAAAGLALTAVALAASVAGCAAWPQTCGLCRREIHPEERTLVTFDDDRHVGACCPRCALRVVEESGARAGGIEVTDYQGGSTLPITGAWLVNDSNETPCLKHHPPVTSVDGSPIHTYYDRCMPSLIAFRDEAAARAFTDEHGGTLEPPGSIEDRQRDPARSRP